MEHARLFHEAQQATRARDDVLAVVAHDLRNPLNTVTMAVGLMLEQTPVENVQERRQVEIVRRAADRMNRMIQGNAYMFLILHQGQILDLRR